MSGQNNLTGADGTKDEKSKTFYRAPPSLDQKVQDAIGRSLKALYDDLAHAPVPEKLLALLAELEAKEEERES